MNTLFDTKPPVKSLMLIGRRWFQKTYGNTYHTVEIYVNGKCVHKCDRTYGYGSQWEWTARQWLKQNNYLPGIEERDGSPGESLFRYCERNGIVYVPSVTDVTRKRDL